MEAVIFIGIQATGKSTFYKTKFFNSHVRLSMDLLNTRNKENRFLETCFQTQSRFVIDNTNPSIESRNKYIRLAKKNKYKVVGYYFNSSIENALQRNDIRKGKEKIPEIGIKACHKSLVIPSREEGFDKLYFVKICKNDFVIEDWKDEV